MLLAPDLVPGVLVEVGDARAPGAVGSLTPVGHAPESTTAARVVRDDRGVLRTIVEGEPGIFPDPVARLMRGIGGLFRRRPRPDAAPDAPAGQPTDQLPDAPAGPPSGDAAAAPATDGATIPGPTDRAPGAEGR